MNVVRKTRLSKRSRSDSSSRSVAARSTRRCIRFSTALLMCWSGKSRYGRIRLEFAITSINSSLKWIG